ncbi:cation:dicarboxylase symporter family transporter, partial [Acinetobacter baumannii]
LAMGIAVALVIKPGEIDKTNLAIQDASKYTKNPATSFDWIQFFNSNLTLQVLLFSILFGIALSYSKHRIKVMEFLHKLSRYVFMALKYVM